MTSDSVFKAEATETTMDSSNSKNKSSSKNTQENHLDHFQTFITSYMKKGHQSQLSKEDRNNEGAFTKKTRGKSKKSINKNSSLKQYKHHENNGRIEPTFKKLHKPDTVQSRQTNKNEKMVAEEHQKGDEQKQGQRSAQKQKVKYANQDYVSLLQKNQELKEKLRIAIEENQCLYGRVVELEAVMVQSQLKEPETEYPIRKNKRRNSL